MKNIPTFEEFVNESFNVTRTLDPSSMVSFNESTGPYKAGFHIFYGEEDGQSAVFPHLGDKGLKMLVSGPGFISKWAKSLKINEKHWSKMHFNIPKEEMIKLAKNGGFKKSGDAYEKDVRTPEDALKELVDFFRPIIDKIN
jgi:hypothetical protein